MATAKRRLQHTCLAPCHACEVEAMDPPWPWDDRGRSAITREQIEREAMHASFLYGQAMNTVPTQQLHVIRSMI